MRIVPLLLALVSHAHWAPVGLAQTTEFLIDFGDDKCQTGPLIPGWNDLHNKSSSQVIALVDSAGNATNVTLTSIQPIGRFELTGVQVPDPGSELEQLGWPLSAISDSLLGDSLSSVPEAELALEGFDPSATYDFTLLASVLGSGVSLTAEYITAGEDTVTSIGEAAENTSQLLHMRGIRPDPSGDILLRLRSATTNTSINRNFYINAASIAEYPAGTRPELVAFTTNRLDVGRVIEKGPVTTSLQLYTGDASTPAVDLQATDLGTGLVPTWLSTPMSALVDTPFDVTLDPLGLTPGTYTAQLIGVSEPHVAYGMLVEFVVRDPGRLNLLYYGNSYTSANGSVHVMVDRLAGAAGFEVPASVQRLYSGKNLGFHLNPTQVTAISRSLPLGEEWDFAVLQGGTTEAAATIGNPSNFVADGLAITANVRAHSPEAQVAIYQTWARGEGHSLYTGASPAYPGPLDMHFELEDGNEQLAAAIDKVYGAGTTVVGPAGETAALRGFDPAFYKTDLSHPSVELTAQAALAVFSAIYGAPACKLAVDFETPGPLALHLEQIGIAPEAWPDLAGIADRAGSPALRKYPGAGEDFLLTSGAPASLTACGVKPHPAGQPLRFELTSPAGSYGAAPALIYVDVLHASGGTTALPFWPEVHVTPSASIQALATALGPGLACELIPPPELVGHALLVQGFSEIPSVNSGHGQSVSDAHLVRVQVPISFEPSKKP